MKKTLLAGIIMSFGICFSFPRISVGELFTRSTCPGCVAAHQFLLENRVLWEDSAAVLRFHLDDRLSIPAGLDRYRYYSRYCDSMGYIPHMFIDGEDYFSNYSNWIMPMLSHALAGSHVGIEKIMHTDDSVGFWVFLDEDGIEGEYNLMAVLTVDGLVDTGITFNWVVQRVYTDGDGEEIMLAHGDTLEFRYAFDFEPGWDPHDCIFVAYVSGPELPFVQNALKLPTYHRPDYDFSIATLRRKGFCDPGGTTSCTLFVQNTGHLYNDLSVRIVTLSAPSGWEARLSSGTPEMTVGIESLATAVVPITFYAPVRGIGRYAAVVHTDELASRFDTLYFTIGSGLDVLLVNDMQAPDSARYIDYLSGTDLIYLYWHIGPDGALPPFSTIDIDKIIWYCGEDTINILLDDEKEQIRNYILSLGGRFVISGSAIGRLYSTETAFYRLALGGQYGGLATSFNTVSANSGYPVFEGWNATLDVSSAEIVNPSPAFGAVGVFRYGDGTSAGIAKDSPTSRVLFFGFPIENIVSHTAFDSLMSKCIRFLDEGFGAIEDGVNVYPAMTVSVCPNPFNSVCEISVPDGFDVEIFDINGKSVYRMNAKICSDLTWMPDENVGSGIYLVRAISKKQDIPRMTISKHILYLK